MKTVLVACYEAWPPASGAASVTYNLARFLSGERKLIQLVPVGGFQGDIDGFSVESIKVGLSSGPRRSVKIISLMKSITQKIAEYGPEVVILEGASWSVYFYFLLKYLRSMASTARPFVVYHAHNVEYLLRRRARSRPVAGLTRLAERYVVRNADLVTACSEIDAGHFKRLYNLQPAVLPNGVDTALFGTASTEDLSRARDLLGTEGPVVTFLGLTAYPPNKEAIEFLVRSVFPLVNREIGKARLAIIGGPVDYHEDWLLVTGSLPFGRIPSVLAASDVCVAPVFSGSGTRLKILEYMAASRPVVATRKGVEGLEISDGENVILAETAGETAEKICLLLRDLELAGRVGRAGRELVAGRYDWKKILWDFETELTSIMKKEEKTAFLNSD